MIIEFLYPDGKTRPVELEHLPVMGNLVVDSSIKNGTVYRVSQIVYDIQLKKPKITFELVTIAKVD